MQTRYVIPVALIVMALAGVAVAAEKPTFGFSGMEFHKLDWDTQNLRLADVNNDGLTDVLVVNNARARIECLLQRKNPAEAEAEEPEPNELPNDPRFKSRPFLTQKQVFAMEADDMNNDGRADLVYQGDPRELVVVYQDEKGEWGPRRTFDIADASPQQYSLAVGDLNGDGLNDIALLGTDGVYFIYQDKDGKLDAPVKDSGLPTGAIAILIRDYNADKRQDMLYICPTEPSPFCFRFQTEDGRLGPEVRCEAPPFRSLTPADINGDGSSEIGVVQMQLSRVVLYHILSESSETSLLDGPFDRYALRSTASRRAHALTFGRFTDKQEQQILVANPDGAEMELFIPAAGGAWHRRAGFPSLTGVADVAALDTDQDGLDEVLALSPDEPMLGLARFDDKGQMAFPRALPIVGKPTAMAVGNLMGDATLEVAYASLNERDRSVRVLAPKPDGTFEEKAVVQLQDARADADGLMIADANQDGIQDILVFLPYQEMRVLKGDPTGKFIDISRGADYGKGLVQGLKAKSVGLADVTGDGKPELLVASRNFARALRVDEQDRLTVVAQFNGRSANSQIVAAVGADLSGDGSTEIILVDSANRCLTVLDQNAEGGYEIAENMTIGPISLERLQVQPATGQKPLILLVGQGDFSILRPGAPKMVLRELADYETTVREGRLDSITAGDLNGDGITEFVMTEATKNLMEIAVWSDEAPQIRRVVAWPVYEAKSFRGDRGGQSEPREFDIGDVTNDGLPDLVLLIHDRVIVYVQE